MYEVKLSDADELLLNLVGIFGFEPEFAQLIGAKERPRMPKTESSNSAWADPWANLCQDFPEFGKIPKTQTQPIKQPPNTIKLTLNANIPCDACGNIYIETYMNTATFAGGLTEHVEYNLCPDCTHATKQFITNCRRPSYGN